MVNNVKHFVQSKQYAALSLVNSTQNAKTKKLSKKALTLMSNGAIITKLSDGGSLKESEKTLKTAKKFLKKVLKST